MSERITGTVEKIRYHKPETGWTVLVVRLEGGGAEVTVVGVFPAIEQDEPIVAVGSWRNDKRWGRQFLAESLTVVVPTSRDGIQRYLAAGHVKGIGSSLAKRLLDHFGDGLFRVIDEEPERLREVQGIGKAKLGKIKSSWNEQRGVRDLMVFLAGHGIGGARAFRIHKQYGEGAVAMIRDNPYRLAEDVRGIGFRTADAIARSLGCDPKSPFRAAAGMRYVIEEARAGGHCGLPLEKAVAEAASLLGIERPLLEQAAAEGVAGGAFIAETIAGKPTLFLPHLHRAETRIGLTLAALAREEPPWYVRNEDKAIFRAERDGGITLDPQQREALRTVFRSKLTVITGGPGVGKTTLVNAILDVLQKPEIKVRLAAPTGRAAKRLSESTGRHAMTIHRLLEMSPEAGGFQRNEVNRLECDLLVVDETSMVDVPLLDALLRALPEKAGVVLVGDADQLPSVGPGQVLHDIIASERVPVVRLTHIHRQAEGSDIVLNAHRINRGERPRFRAAEEGSDMFRFRADSAEAAVNRIVELVTDRIPRRFGFHPLRDVQVLSPMRTGGVGVNVLNAELQRALNPSDKQKVRIERPNDVVFARGDKVMQIENNYEKGVFNGDVGVVAAINTEEEKMTVDYGGEMIVEYHFDELDQLVLAYATTIHKSQGSEYPAVIIALMPQHRVMLQRNLLYTAVTRGRKLVVVVGDTASIDIAVRTGRVGERCTRLKQCLIEADALR
ncbi:MAG TPA: ATP-dependent RecD-like DNA helicase [Thermoanaerobaculia bacterium]|nr:ATP-dependent RecD-like DNA helicase [Thermoanaerobaculia bacterium]